jgi:hypothetical protein
VSEEATEEDVAVQAIMATAYGHEIAAAAFAAFDAWRGRQPDEVRDLDLLDQVMRYAAEMGA